MSEPSTPERDRIEKLADSFMASYRAGQRPSIDAYVEQYPELAGELRGLIAALIVLERNAPRRGRTEHPAIQRTAQGPQEIGEFSIIREIGRGGMGVVYEAIQQSLGRHVALKVLSTGSLLNPTHLERFRLEARSAGRLHHSHIVPVFGVGESDGLHYYAMQFIAGQSLDQVIEALRKMRPGHDNDKASSAVNDELTEPVAANGDASVADEPSTATKQSVTGQFSSGSSGRPFYESVARVGLQVAEALAYAHGEGVLHRDIKPSNLLVDAKGDTWVTDFGLVKAEDTQSLTETGDFVGTLRYMAPERLEGWSDRRSDIYSLGATLYELLTLRTFFETANRGQLVDHVRHKQPAAPTKIDAAIPRDLETIVLKALSKEPGSRYHTAHEMAEDLRRFLADRPILARRITPAERFVRWCRRSPAVASLTAMVAVALIAGTIGSSWQAIRATRAEQLADQRSIAEADARRAADVARSAESEQRKLAEVKQAEAEANYRHARETVDKYFSLVSENTLLDVPGLQPLRKDLLEAAADFYDASTLQRADDPAALAELARTHLQLSQVYFAMDRIDDSVIKLRHGLDLTAKLQKHPQAAEFEPHLAGFWKGLRWGQLNVKQPRNPLVAVQTMLRLESVWTQLIERHPAEARFRSDLVMVKMIIGLALKDNKRINEAIDRWRTGKLIGEKLVQEHPDEHQYRADLACVCLLLGDWVNPSDRIEGLAITRQAMQLTERLAADFPQMIHYRFLLNRSLTQLGRMLRDRQSPDAAPILRRSTELADVGLNEFPGYAMAEDISFEAVIAWAPLAASLGEYSEVNSFVSRLTGLMKARIDKDPHSSYIRRQLGFLHHGLADALLWGRNDAAAAEAHDQIALTLFEAIPLPEQIGWTSKNLGEIARRADRPEEARKHFERAATEFAALADDQKIDQRGGFYRKSQFDMLSQLVQLLSNSGQADELVQVCKRQIRLSETSNQDLKPQLAGSYMMLSYALLRSRQPEESAAAWKRALETGPPDAYSLNRFAWTLVATADVEPVIAQFAVQVAEQATKAAPGNASLWNTLGVAQYRAGQWEGAIVSLIKAEGPGPENPLAVLYQNKHMAFDGFFLAMAHQRLGRTNEAHQWYGRSVEWMEKHQPKHEELLRFRAEAEQLLGIAMPDRPPVAGERCAGQQQGGGAWLGHSGARYSSSALCMLACARSAAGPRRLAFQLVIDF